MRLYSIDNSYRFLKRSWIPSLLFFFVYFIIGWTISPDYGVSWDEFLQRRYGMMSFDYVVKTLNLPITPYYPDYNLETSAGRQYSVIFPLIAAGMEKFLGIGEENYYAQIQLRHRMLFGLFWIASICFYQILRLRFNNSSSLKNENEFSLNKWLPLAGTLFLILTPRIFAHSFFNPKDMVLLSFYIISLYSLLRFLKSQSLMAGLLHGVACAFVVNSRVPGIIVPVLTAGFIFLQIITANLSIFSGAKEKGRLILSRYTRSLPVFLLTFTFFGIAFFPYLWGDFDERASEAFNIMSNFPKGFQTLLFGKFVASNPAPFYYPYAWMAITLPPLNAVLILGGIILFLRKFFKNLYERLLWKTFPELMDVVLFAFMVGPLFAVWLFQSTLYDGWRHLYFVYPSALVLGIVALHRLLNSKTSFVKWTAVIAVIISFGFNFFYIFKNHPHQQVYFNVFAGENRLERFEMDYWGVSYKQAFEELVRRDTSEEQIHVFCANQACIDNYFALPEEFKSRIRIRWGIEVAKYYLTNYRFEPEFKKYRKRAFPFEKEYFTIDVDGEKVIGVYDLGID
jgi:hypothetical protein